MLRLRMFGGLAVDRDTVPVTEIAEQHKSLALLALLATSGERALSRDRLAAYLWPESDAERARAALSQTLYALRKQLGESELFTGTRSLRLSSALIGSDVRDFGQALDRNDPETAIALYDGPFLDGFFLPESPELERWIDETRADLGRRVVVAMESLARAASERGEYAVEGAWWRRLAALEPGNSRVVAALVSALARAGDRGGALLAARVHEEFLRTEFEASPDAVVSALADEIRKDTSASVPPTSEEDDARAHAARDLRRAVEDAAFVSAPTARTSPTNATVARRRAVRIAVLAGGLAAAVAIASFAPHKQKQQSAALSEQRIAVSGFDNETGDSSLASIGRIATEWVVQGLVQTQLVEVVAPGVLESKLPALGDSVLRRGAGLIVHGSYSRLGDSLVMQARITDASSGRVVRGVDRVTGPLTEPLVAIERLRQRLAGALATRVDSRLSRWSDAASQPTSFEAYRAFDEGLSEFFGPDDSAQVWAGRQFVHAAALDTGFSLPLLWATYAFSNAGDTVRLDSVIRVLEARRERLPRFDRALLDARAADVRHDKLAEYEALRHVVAIAPNSEWVFKLADAAIGLERWVEADSLLTALDPNAGWMREWPRYWADVATVKYYVGHHDEELNATVQGRSRFPGTWYGPEREEGRALGALGRERELLTLLDDELGSSPRRVDLEGLFRIMSAARVHGHLQLARAVAERALRLHGIAPDIGNSLAARARFKLLVLEASEQWEDAAATAKRMVRLDSIAGRHDALPYMVLLQAALHRGSLNDTAGLETRALAAAAVPSGFAEDDSWSVESTLAVRAELAALRRNARSTATLLAEARDRGLFNYYSFSERAAFDPVRGDPLVAKWLHNPAIDRTPTRQ